MGLLVAPAKAAGMIVVILLCTAAAVLLWGFRRKTSVQPIVRSKLFIYDLAITVLLGQSFYLQWIPSSKIERLAEIVYLPKHVFLISLTCGIGFASLFALDAIFQLGIKTVNKWLNHTKKNDSVRKIMIILIVVLIEYYLFGVSSVYAVSRIIHIPLVAFIANYGILLCANILLFFLFRKWKRALSFSSVIVFLWSVANYYTIQFHGSPLYLSEFLNVGAAAAVAMQYRYQVTGVVIGLFLLVMAAFVTIHHSSALLDNPVFSHKNHILVISLIAIIVSITALCSSVSLGRFQNWRPWDLSMDANGFIICVIEDLKLRVKPINVPDDYDESVIEEVIYRYPDQGAPDGKGNYPDIILVLNESFCDLNSYSELYSDRDCLETFFEIDGAAYGLAAAPSIGGGTNNSEFELMTSKSMHLLNNYAPFTYLKSEVLGCSTIHYLKQCGYQTAGMHCGARTTYARNRAYPFIGFDSVVLGPESFLFHKNGNRDWLDADNYHIMIKQYESMDAPRFVYLLTFQNHGGYEQNDASLDTVHVQNDFGSLTDDVDEYLSSLELSAQAFRELTEHYTESDRKVIICMVGDHAPSFITSLPAKSGMSFEESEIAKRLVPYVIWSNYGAEIPSYSEYASMVDLLPMVMEAAGLPLPPFYRYILDLHEDYPVRTANGLYMDAEGNYGSIFDDPQARERMSIYYNMEYNSLTTDGSYRSELFEVK